VVFNAVAVTAQQDLFQVSAAADAITTLIGVYLSQSTEVGDAQEEGLNILFKRGLATTIGSGGTTPTPQPMKAGAAAAYGGVTMVNNTTKQSAGTITTIHADNWNVRAPFVWIPTPEFTPVLGPGTTNRFTIELATTPADSITMSGTCYFEEIG
jgi:hypothetical protein